MTVMTRVNQLELRLVKDGPELDAAQALRFQVFYDEMGAVPSPAMQARQRDFDGFDAIADHLVVVDLERSTRFQPFVVGCYRLLREHVAAAAGGFYTAAEFDLAAVKAPYGEIMELGRSCTRQGYRDGMVVQLLWRGIADYLETYEVGMMLGCASLPGNDPDALAPILSYLHHRHLAPKELRPRAVAHRFVPTDRLPLERIDERQVLRDLPPLLKGYLRLGGMIGDGAVIDTQFNTTDVCLVLPTTIVRARAQRLFRQLAAVPAAA